MAGKGNYPRRETKKPKKDTKKFKGVGSILPTPITETVGKKERKPKRIEEEGTEEEQSS